MRNIVAAIICFILVFSALPSRAQFNPGGGGGGGSSVPFADFIDPTVLFSADTTATATTGTITNGTNSLSVASAATWSVGQGIAIASAGTNPSGTTNAELVGCVGSISGTTFTIVVCGSTTPHNATACSTTCTSVLVNHDDTYALQQAEALAESSNRPVVIPGGTYLLTDTITFSKGISFSGVGLYPVTFYNRGTTNDVFKVVGGFGMLLQNIDIAQFSGITPTAGYGINLIYSDTSPCATNYISTATIARINIINTYGGLNVGPGVITSSIRDMLIYGAGAGYGVNYNNGGPCGDNVIDNVQTNGGNTSGFTIVESDTTSFLNIKTNGTGQLLFSSPTTTPGSPGQIGRVRFISPSFEGVGVDNCNVQFGANGAWGVTITGGGIGVGPSGNAICNGNNNINGAISNTIGYVIGTNAASGYGMLNAQWPTPVVTGCATSGQPIAGSDALHGSMTVTCTSATLDLIFATQSSDTGWSCTVTDVTTPSHLIVQTSWFYNTAMFGNVTTGTNEKLIYSCSPRGLNASVTACAGVGDLAPAYAWGGVRAYSSGTCGARFANVCSSLTVGGTDLACADMLTSSTTGAVVPQVIGGVTCPNSAGTCSIKILYDQTLGGNCGGSCDLLQSTPSDRFQFVTSTPPAAPCLSASLCMYGTNAQMSSAGSMTLPTPFSFGFVGYFNTMGSVSPHLMDIENAFVVNNGVDANHYYYVCDNANVNSGAVDVLSTQLYDFMITCPTGMIQHVAVYSVTAQTITTGSAPIATQSGQLIVGSLDAVQKILEEVGWWNNDQGGNVPVLGADRAAFWSIP